MKFGRALFLIAVVAFGVRVAYVAFAKSETCSVRAGTVEVATYPSECVLGDQVWYNSEANAVADGKGFVEPLWEVDHPGEDAPPAADHPPLTVFVLAPVSWIVEHPLAFIAGDDFESNVREHRYTMVLLGTLLVVMVGFLGRRVDGDTTGLVAAGIAALAPNIWVNDGLVMSETITGCVVVGALWLGVIAAKRPSPWTIAALGAVCGLAGLARAELLLFVPLLAVPMALRRPDMVQRVLMAVGAAVIVVAPWVIYNMTRFEARTFVSTNDGVALAGSNCDPVYSGKGIGLTTFEPPCLDAVPPPGDQSEVAEVYRNRAREYVEDNLSRAPIVALARVGRTWSLYRPLDMVEFNRGEGREPWVTRLGLVVFYPTLVAAIAGAVVLARRRVYRVLWVLLVPVVTVTIGAALTYGQTRFRAAAEPTLAVLAAVAIVALVRKLRISRRDEPLGLGNSLREPLGLRPAPVPTPSPE